MNETHTQDVDELAPDAPEMKDPREGLTAPETDAGGFLTKEAILEAPDVVTEVVDVPEWGGKVRVKALTAKERDAFESSLVQNKGKKSQYTDMRNVRAKMASLSIVDGNGERMFNAREVEALGNKSAAALDRVFQATQRLSKITDEDVEELTGNSEGGHSEGSSVL